MCYLILTNAGGKFRENILIHINYFYLRKIDVEEQTLLRISRNESKQIFITPTCETHKSVQLARATIFSSFPQVMRYSIFSKKIGIENLSLIIFSDDRICY